MLRKLTTIVALGSRAGLSGGALARGGGGGGHGGGGGGPWRRFWRGFGGGTAAVLRGTAAVLAGATAAGSPLWRWGRLWRLWRRGRLGRLG